MTRVAKNEQSPRQSNDFAHDLGDLDRDHASARGRQRGMNAHTQFDFSEEALLSRDAFSQEGSHGREDHPAGRRDPEASRSKDDHAKKDKDAESVIAMASGLMATGAAPPAGPIQTASIETSGAGSVDEILLRIEQAVRASLHTGDGAPLAFKVRLDDLQIPGLQSLQVAMTAGALDVSLGRDAGPLTPQMIAAAQSLAGQLAIRFPTRVVRVLDVDPDSGREREQEQANSGMRGISDLLGRGGARS